MSGYCAIGITSRDNSPAIVVTIAMTVARRGRSMKMAENTRSAPAERRWCRAGDDRRARAKAFQSLNDDLLAALQAIFDDGIRARLTAQLYAFDRRLAVHDKEDIRTLLIDDQRGLRHQYFSSGLSASTETRTS